jgi:hypothetical protein
MSSPHSVGRIGSGVGLLQRLLSASGRPCCGSDDQVGDQHTLRICRCVHVRGLTHTSGECEARMVLLTARPVCTRGVSDHFHSST